MGSIEYPEGGRRDRGVFFERVVVVFLFCLGSDWGGFGICFLLMEGEGSCEPLPYAAKTMPHAVGKGRIRPGIRRIAAKTRLDVRAV